MNIKIGDKVYWSGSPNELSCNRSGIIVKIKGDIAFIHNPILGTKIRQVPVKILKNDCS